MYKTILYEEKENIAYITFNRPEVGNAFSEESFREIPAALTKASEDATIRAVVLTGKGKLFWYVLNDRGGIKVSYIDREDIAKGNTAVKVLMDFSKSETRPGIVIE